MTAVEVPTDIPTPAAHADHLFRRLLRNPLARGLDDLPRVRAC